VEPKFEPVILKNVGGPEYSDYYKQRMELEQEKDTLEAKLRELRRSRDRDGLRQLQRDLRQNQTKVAKLELTHPGAPPRAMVLEDLRRPHDSPVFIRGDAGKKGDIVPRHFLEVLSSYYRPAFTNGSGRLDLAWAIVSKQNPLTPRVLVNRLWLHHFGEGFVSSPDDLGTRCEPPSNPQLLDYLAARIVEDGWSLKKMHRLIMNSSVYQESSANNPRYAQLDPDNRLLWRANIRRLEFEALRDSLLTIGGDLDQTMFGRPVDIESEPFSTRRTVYGKVDRSDVADVLVNFDFANPDMPTGRRHDTTVPQQALFLMNSPLVIEQAKKLVALPGFLACSDEPERIRFLYERIYQRPPRSEEVRLGEDFIDESAQAEKASPGDQALRPVSNEQTEVKPMALREPGRKARALDRKRAPLKAWEEYAHALLQANETSFVN
jgi:hypothetical protein